MPTHYEILGCDKKASYEEIKKCYHYQVKKFHPDKSNEGSMQFFAVDKAWKVLQNADTRREYDLEIAKYDMSEMPLFCEIKLSEMCHDSDAEIYSFSCRCGGLYILNKCEINDIERLQIPCNECTFHIDILLSK